MENNDKLLTISALVVTLIVAVVVPMICLCIFGASAIPYMFAYWVVLLILAAIIILV